MAGLPYRLLYDGDCRICIAFARWARAVDRRNRIRIQPIQESRDLLGGIPDNLVLDAMHVVAPDGRVATGGDSIPTLLEALFAGPPLASLLRTSSRVRALLRVLYGVVVELRGHLICRVEPASAAPPSSDRP